MFHHICFTCKKQFDHEWSKRKYCSRECFKKSPLLIERARKLGQENKGKKRIRKPTEKRPGFYINHNGYKLIKKNGHPTAQKTGYIMEHRYIMEQHLGRLLNKSERVHHLNNIKGDNRIENLQLFPDHSCHIRYYHLNKVHFVK